MMRWKIFVLAAVLSSTGAARAAEEESNPPPSAAQLETAAREALKSLAEAYTAKRRSAFMRFVSDEFLGDSEVLEDALAKDFRNYRSVNLDLIPDRVQVQAPLTSIEFHYNLNVITDQGVNSNFSGRSNYVFRWEEGKSKLYKMDRPIIFGNSLPSSENPVASSQNSPTAAASTVPGALGGSATQSGSASIQEGSTGFKFDTQSNTSVASADIRMQGGMLEAGAGGAVESIGACTLASVSSVSSTISGNASQANNGECYAFRTPAGKFGVILVTALNLPDLSFEYKFQPSGSSSF
jgi:hypothetical protein